MFPCSSETSAPGICLDHDIQSLCFFSFFLFPFFFFKFSGQLSNQFYIKKAKEVSRMFPNKVEGRVEIASCNFHLFGLEIVRFLGSLARSMIIEVMWKCVPDSIIMNSVQCYFSYENFI